MMSNYFPTGGVNSGLSSPTTTYGRYSPSANRQNLGQFATGERLSSPQPLAGAGGALAPLAQLPPKAAPDQFANPMPTYNPNMGRGQFSSTDTQPYGAPGTGQATGGGNQFSYTFSDPPLQPGGGMGPPSRPSGLSSGGGGGNNSMGRMQSSLGNS